MGDLGAVVSFIGRGDFFSRENTWRADCFEPDAIRLVGDEKNGGDQHSKDGNKKRHYRFTDIRRGVFDIYRHDPDGNIVDKT